MIQQNSIKIVLGIALLSCFFSTILFGQTTLSNLDNREMHSMEFSCGSDQEQIALFNQEPEYYKSIQEFKKVSSLLQKKKIHLKSNTQIYTIPVVVHIIHNGDALGSEENPTDEQIALEVQQASDRFRHQHSGAGSYSNPYYGVDNYIELRLAEVDASGNATTGVVRHQEPIHYLNPDPVYVRDNILWDQNKYANMIIAKEIFGACGRYRGGSYDYTEYSTGCWWDGLIAHEIGHYFSLDHTFVGCSNDDCTMDNDGVCDTPAKDGAGTNGFSCDAPGNDCSTDDDDTSVNNPYRPIDMGGLGDQPDMLENYMDYTAGCWDSFTEGQKNRMRLFIETFRSNLVSDCPLNYAGINKLTGTQSSASTFATDGIIESDQTIDAPVDYNSDAYIQLLANFEVRNGKLFQAYLDGCTQGQ